MLQFDAHQYYAQNYNKIIDYARLSLLCQHNDIIHKPIVDPFFNHHCGGCTEMQPEPG